MKKGFSLPELLVIIAISAMMLAGLMNVFSSSKTQLIMTDEETTIVRDYGLLLHKLNFELNRSLLTAGTEPLIRIRNSYEIPDDLKSLKFSTAGGEVSCRYDGAAKSLELTTKDGRLTLFKGIAENAKFAVLTVERPGTVDRFCIALGLTVKGRSFSKPFNYLIKFFPREANYGLLERYWVPVPK